MRAVSLPFVGLMRMSLRISLAGFLFAFFLHGNLAYADDALERALVVANEAAELFQAENYVAAAAKFREAYGLYAEPTLLKNQIVSYYRADLCNEVLTFGREYQVNEGSQPLSDREDVRFMRIECLYRSAFAAYQSHELELADREISVARSIGIKTDEEIAKFKNLESLIETRRNPKPPAESSSDLEVLPIVGWSLLGVGAVGLGVAGILHRGYISEYNDVDEPFRARPPESITAVERAAWTKALKDYEESRNALIPIYAIGGAFAAAGGGILIYHYFIASPDSTAQIIPMIGPNGAGVQVGFSF